MTFVSSHLALCGKVAAAAIADRGRVAAHPEPGEGGREGEREGGRERERERERDESHRSDTQAHTGSQPAALRHRRWCVSQTRRWCRSTFASSRWAACTVPPTPTPQTAPPAGLRAALLHASLHEQVRRWRTTSSAGRACCCCCQGSRSASAVSFASRTGARRGWRGCVLRRGRGRRRGIMVTEMVIVNSSSSSNNNNNRCGPSPARASRRRTAPRR